MMNHYSSAPVTMTLKYMAVLITNPIGVREARPTTTVRYGAVRSSQKIVKRAWRLSRPVLFQIALAVAIALVLASLVGHERPIGAPLFAVATLELVCAKRHRHIAWMVFG